MAENQVAKAEAKKTAVAVPKNMLDSMIQDAGAGTENITSDDMKIPFLRVLQPLSPECSKRDEAYIEGAEAGLIFNTVTRQLYGEKIQVIPCAYQKKYLEFVPRDQGGGFRGELAANSEEVLGAVRNEQNKDILPGGNELVISAQHYCKFQDPSTGSWQSAIIDMKATSLKVSRQWNTMIQMQEVQHEGKSYKLPTFGVIWDLVTADAENDKGRWNTWKIDGRHGYVEDQDLYQDCKDFSEMVAGGSVQAAEDPDTVAPTGGSEEAPPF